MIMNALKEHESYLKNLKKRKVKIVAVQISILVIFITLWQILSDFKIINSFLCSSPLKVIKTIINLSNSNDLLRHILVTLKEILISFGLGSIIGIVFAAFLWWFPFASKVLDPYLTLLNSLPKVALGPIIIIWLGANTKSIIMMAILISIITSIQSIYNG